MRLADRTSSQRSRVSSPRRVGWHCIRGHSLPLPEEGPDQQFYSTMQAFDEMIGRAPHSSAGTYPSACPAGRCYGE
jgi:hypothetical protein